MGMVTISGDEKEEMSRNRKQSADWCQSILYEPKKSIYKLINLPSKLEKPVISFHVKLIARLKRIYTISGTEDKMWAMSEETWRVSLTQGRST